MAQTAFDLVKKLIESHPDIPLDIRITDASFHREVYSLANDILKNEKFLNEIGAIITDLSNEKYFGDSLNGKILQCKTVLEKQYQSKYNGALLCALKIAFGKSLLRVAKKEKPNGFHLSVIIPMYGEQDRIAPYDAETNPYGQEFVNEKYKQLSWVFDEVTANGDDVGEEEKKEPQDNDKRFTWNLLFVDDGCYENPKRFDSDNNYRPKYLSSFELASKVIYDGRLSNARAIKLGDVCARVNVAQDQGQEDNTILYFKDITNPSKGSRRGGAVAYGMYVANTECKPKDTTRAHYIATSDADLSMHLGQVGGLIYELQSKEKARMCVGARYGNVGSFLGYPDGIVIDESAHLGPNRVRIVCRHVLRSLLIPGLKHVYDTQVPLKVFESTVIDTVLASAKDRESSFEIETLLLVISKYGENAIATYPTYFTEDFESSKFTTGDNPGAYYFGQCKNILAMYRSFVEPTQPIKDDGSEPERVKALQYVENVTNDQFEEQWTAIQKNIPSDAFFGYKITIDNIIDPTTLIKK